MCPVKVKGNFICHLFVTSYVKQNSSFCFFPCCLCVVFVFAQVVTMTDDFEINDIELELLESSDEEDFDNFGMLDSAEDAEEEIPVPKSKRGINHHWIGNLTNSV